MPAKFRNVTYREEFAKKHMKRDEVERELAKSKGLTKNGWYCNELGKDGYGYPCYAIIGPNNTVYTNLKTATKAHDGMSDIIYTGGRSITEIQKIDEGIEHFGWSQWNKIADTIPSMNRIQIQTYANDRSKRDQDLRTRMIHAYDTNEDKREVTKGITCHRGKFVAQISRTVNGVEVTQPLGSYTIKEQAGLAYKIAVDHHKNWSRDKPHPTEAELRECLVAARDAAWGETTHRCESTKKKASEVDRQTVIFGPRRSVCHGKYFCRVNGCELQIQGGLHWCCFIHGKIFKELYGGEEKWQQVTGQISNPPLQTNLRRSDSVTNNSDPAAPARRPEGMKLSFIIKKINQILKKNGGKTGMPKEAIIEKVKEDYPEDIHLYSDELVENRLKQAVEENEVKKGVVGTVTVYMLTRKEAMASGSATKVTAKKKTASGSKRMASTSVTAKKKTASGSKRMASTSLSATSKATKPKRVKVTQKKKPVTLPVGCMPALPHPGQDRQGYVEVSRDTLRGNDDDTLKVPI